jgi:hypothetical protein
MKLFSQFQEDINQLKRDLRILKRKKKTNQRLSDIRNKEKEGVDSFRDRRQVEKEKGLILHNKAKSEIEGGLENTNKKEINSNNPVVDIADTIGRSTKSAIKKTGKLTAKLASKLASRVKKSIRKK